MATELSDKVLKKAFEGMFREYGYEEPELAIEAIFAFADDHVTNEEDFDRMLTMLFEYTAVLLAIGGRH